MRARWIFLLPFLYTVGLSVDYIYASDSDPVVCHEDEPCWDCETMGNLICGPLPTVQLEPATPITHLPETK